MARFFIPLILVIAAIGLFVMYTNPTYKSTQPLAVQADAYEDALVKAQELRTVRDTLLQKRNAFANSDVVKLERMLPDNVDNIRLIIDINNIAVRHNLTLTDVSLGEISDRSAPRTDGAVGSSGDPIGSVEVGFTLLADYDGYLAFLQDLEHSLRIVDVIEVNFSAENAIRNSYEFTIRTYWLQ